MARYDIRVDGHRALVAFTSNLTLAIVPDLHSDLKAVLAGGLEELVFDLAGTTHLDSSGMGLLIASSNSLAKSGGRIRVINVSSEIVQLLKSMRLADRLNVTGSESEG
jgi:anti-sigma B factor antagonist